MFGLSWTEHVYMFQPASASGGSYIGKVGGDPYEIRVYKNKEGLVVWATGETAWPGTNGLWPKINKGFFGNPEHPNLTSWQETSWIGWKKEWKRSYSDVKFLLSFERTREDFLKKVAEGRVTYLLYPSKEVQSAVLYAVGEAESGRGRTSIGAYSGPASLSIETLKSLGCKVCHRPPTKRFPKVAGGNYVVENFNYGADAPDIAEWFRYGAGYRFNGSVGINPGWIWRA